MCTILRISFTLHFPLGCLSAFSVDLLYRAYSSKTAISRPEIALPGASRRPKSRWSNFLFSFLPVTSRDAVRRGSDRARRRRGRHDGSPLAGCSGNGRRKFPVAPCDRRTSSCSRQPARRDRPCERTSSKAAETSPPDAQLEACCCARRDGFLFFFLCLITRRKGHIHLITYYLYLQN